jgi:hypothetical protein
MTSTDRNKHRLARLLAREAEAGTETQLLVELHRDLMAAGLREWAGRVAGILRSATISAVSEYTRRNADFFVTNGARLPSTAEREERKAWIVTLADKLTQLSDAAKSDAVEYGHFEAILRDLHKAGFFPDNELVSAVAQGFFLAG